MTGFHFSIGRLRRNEEAVAVIELALAAPLLMLLFVGMVDLSLLASAKIDLEQAAQRTTDYALAKRPTNGDGTYLANEAAGVAKVPLTNVTVELFLECNGVRQVSFDTPCSPGQAQARFASIEIRKKVEMTFNWKKMASFYEQTEQDSEVQLAGDSVVRFQ